MNSLYNSQSIKLESHPEYEENNRAIENESFKIEMLLDARHCVKA